MSAPKLTAEQRRKVKSLIEDEGQSRAEATAWVRAFEPARSLLVSWDGEEVRTVALDTFLADNAEDAFVCGAVGALKPGESVSLGGGAAPACVVVAL